MPAFPSSFPPKREFLANFPFSDIASGTGFIKYFIAGAENDSAVSYLLTELSLTSSNSNVSPRGDNTVFNANGETITASTSVFNLPRTIRGNAYFNWAGKSSSSGDGDFLVQVFIDSTDISSGGVTTHNIGADTATVLPGLIEIPLTQTTVKKGETIKVKITWNKTSGGTYTLDHNGSEAFATIPFRIDLT